MTNNEGNSLLATSQAFYVHIPVITGISVSPTTMGYPGGPTVITVTGKYLQYGKVNSSIDNTN